MNLWCIKLLTFTKNKNIKIKHKVDGKINLCSRWVDWGFKKFETINKGDLSYLLKGWDKL